MEFLTASIRTKIIFPYVLLTLLVGMGGIYVATSLVFDSAEDRLNNELITAGNVAADTIVEQENSRLAVLRQVNFTEGLVEAVIDDAYSDIQEIVLPIAGNNRQIDNIVILDKNAIEIFSVNRAFGLAGSGEIEPPLLASEADFSHWPVVERILTGETDQFGDKFTFLAKAEDNSQAIVYTAGPIRLDTEIVGVILVGVYLRNIINNLKISTLAAITFYDTDGTVLDTTFGPNREGLKTLLAVEPDFYNQVIQDQTRIYKQQASLLGRDYELAFIPFVLRGETVGAYSVGLPIDFIIKVVRRTRDIFIITIFLGIAALLIIAFLVTQQILKPVGKLVTATDRIAAGDLNLLTGVKSGDEIGRLAQSFDQMTVKLKQRTEELEEETSKVRAILTSIADGVLVKDASNNIIEKNPAADEILTWLDDFDADERETTPDSENKLNANSADLLHKVDFEEVKRFDFGDRTLSALAAPVITGDNQMLGSVLVLRDITLEVQAEKQKNTFVELISHELRVPLIAMKGYLDLLQMVSAGKLDDRALGFIKNVNQNREDLNDLIETLIDTNEVEVAGSIGTQGDDDDADSEIYEFDFDDMVLSILEERWKPRMSDAGLTFKIHIQAEELTIKGDEKRLKRVVGYLLDNALKYTHSGGTVEFYLSQEGDNVRIDVFDTGVGISESAKDNIFNTRFFRSLHEDFYEIRGFGMGLYLSRVIIENHGGRIWFESTVDKGSTFSFTLPLVPPDAEDDDW